METCISDSRWADQNLLLYIFLPSESYQEYISRPPWRSGVFLWCPASVQRVACSALSSLEMWPSSCPLFTCHSSATALMLWSAPKFCCVSLEIGFHLFCSSVSGSLFPVQMGSETLRPSLLCSDQCEGPKTQTKSEMIPASV